MRLALRMYPVASCDNMAGDGRETCSTLYNEPNQNTFYKTHFAPTPSRKTGRGPNIEYVKDEKTNKNCILAFVREDILPTKTRRAVKLCLGQRHAALGLARPTATAVPASDLMLTWAPLITEIGFGSLTSLSCQRPSRPSFINVILFPLLFPFSLTARPTSTDTDRHRPTRPPTVSYEPSKPAETVAASDSCTTTTTRRLRRTEHTRLAISTPRG